MRFRFFAFRVTFQALDPVHFPPSAAGNAFRGAFGHIFRRIACVPDCPGASHCEIRHQCAYANLFEPACLDGPSGLADAPRPFVIRAASLDGKSFRPGETFSIDLHLFRLDEPPLAHFVTAFEQLAQEGIGAGRGRIRLVRVSALNLDRQETAAVHPQPNCLEWEQPADAGPTEFLTLRFTTPTELKSEGAILREAPFEIVLARARDRIATLSQLYGDGQMDLDFRGLAERASLVETVASDLRWESHTRTSSRTRQTHPLGGFVGEVRYRGAIAEFLPFLQAAYWTGIGRQTVWGKGVVEIAGKHPAGL
jgi:hypothetical protein